MNGIVTQLLLPGMTRRIHATFANFMPGDNEALLQHLQQLTKQTGFSLTYLWGANGAGVSHLLEACCDAASAQQQSAIYLPLCQLPSTAHALFEGLEQLDWICIDDLDCLEAHSDWQESLFHQFNRMQLQGGRLIIGAKCPAKGLSILADLQSRLASGITWQVKGLSDDDKMTLLMSHAKAKGMRLPNNIALFLLQRYSRSLPDLLAHVDRLDKASLTQKRRLTIPFVKQVLA